MKYHLISSLLVGALLSGCATRPIPQTAAEYRNGIEAVVYKVDRPYSKVVDTLKTKSKECLDAKLAKRVCYNKVSCLDSEVTYTPTMIAGKNKSELHVQWRKEPENAVYLGMSGKPPANGMYVFVFDVEPDGKSKTKVSVFGTTNSEYQTVPNAVKHWAKGTNLGCPDLTKPYYY